MPTKRAVYPVEFKALNDATGQVEALVSIFGNVDLQGDRIVKGAFAKSIADWKQSGDPVPVVFSHEWDDIWSHIGVVDSLQETAKGLRAVYTLDIADNPAAAQVYKLMKRRSLKEHSFAYDVVQEHRAKDGANELTELTIIEVGPTLKGANPDTELIAVKSLLEAETAKRTMRTDSLSGRKVYIEADMPGTFEETQDAICAAAQVLFNPNGDPNIEVWVEATFPDSAIVQVEDETTEEDATYQIPWSLNADPNATNEIVFGTPAAVELSVTITPKSSGAAVKAGARLSVATKTEMQAIHDGMGDLQSRMKTLMGVAEEASTASSDGPEGAKTAAADLNENATEHGTNVAESPTAKSPDASVTDLRTRILAMRATTGVTS